MLEGGEPLAVLYPLPQHFLPLVINSSFCPLADVLTEDAVEAVGRAHGGSVTARTRAVFLCCGAGCLDCRAGQGVGHGCCSWCLLTPNKSVPAKETKEKSRSPPCVSIFTRLEEPVVLRAGGECGSLF
ncbi:NTF2-related export protein 2 isoform X3 [Serinus canaria]|uniref:NTF2-related export protein 2 isoform X3 n=1 Tax=Serinus canaria TaxID=9135 RepID=UPI0021CCE142|nr:NTF2-related export protein 2 isoform X3 [Serinus canaria]